MSLILEIKRMRETEETLRESENRYRSIFDNLVEGIFRTTPEGRHVYANSALAHMLGFDSPEELIGQVTDIGGQMYLDPAIRKRAIDEVCSERGLTKGVETALRRKDGTIIWALISVRSVNNPDGTIRYFEGTMIDITDRKRTEEALQKSEAYLRLATEASGVAIWDWKIETGELTFNDRWAQIIGYTLPELGPVNIETWFRFCHPDDLRDSTAVINKHLAGETPAYECELRMKHKDGHWVWVLDRGKVTEWGSDGKPVRMTGTHIDISERKRVEEALRKNEAYLRLAVEASGVGIWDVNVQTGELAFNDSWGQLIGYKLPELGPINLDTWKSLIHPDDLEVATVRAQKHYAGEIPDYECELRVKHKDGHWVWILDRGKVTEWGPDGEPVRMTGTHIDISERKRIEEALRKSEAYLRLAVEASGVAIWEWNIATGAITFNDCWAQMIGYKLPELAPINIDTWKTLIHPDDLEVADARARKHLAGKIPDYECETRVKHKDGHWVWLLDRGRVTEWGPDGKPVRMTGTHVDITDRKRTEAALQEREATLSSILEAAPVSISIFKDRVFQVANRVTCETLGYDESELLGQSARMVYANEEEYDRVGREMTASFREFGVASIQMKLRRKDGAIRDMIMTAAPLHPDNPMAGTVSALEDITDRKILEAALKEKRRKLENIIEFLPDATFVIDRYGKVTSWNRAIELMTGIPKEEMIGKDNYEYALPFYDERRPLLIDLVLHPETKIEKGYTDIHRVGDLLYGEAYTPKLKTGKSHLYATASVLRDDNGEIIAAIESIRDNTERKNLEERLIRAEKMEVLGRLAGGVAHDLNNVLGILVGFSELLLVNLPSGSPLRKYADNILQSSIRGTAIIQDLLTLARRGVNISEVVDLNKIIRDYLKTPEFEKMQSYHPGVKIITELGDELLNIKGSPIHLSKTVMNLISNAAEAINGNGEVTIRTENRYLDQTIRAYDEMAEGDYAVLTVTDTGSGISAKDLDKIFEPFYTKKVMGRSGTGLGLAVVWGTVKDHNGYIDVQSKEGRGTTFTLYFPVTREETETVEKREVSPASYMGRGESILVVDDVKEQRELSMSILGRLGYRVEAAAGGEEAIAYLKNKKVDLLILDMIMDPGIDGMETYQRILEFNPGQRAIIVSGFSESDRVSGALNMGAGAFVRKPYTLEKIGLAIRNELDRK